MRAAAANPPHTGASRAALDRRFEAIVFDWDGTTVPDRASDATRLRELVERACALGLPLVVISGTHVANVDAQLGPRPTGPRTLHLLLNRGRDVYAVGTRGPRLLKRRPLDPAELERLNEVAERTRSWLEAAGLRDAVVVRRPNRVKIDLIPRMPGAISQGPERGSPGSRGGASAASTGSQTSRPSARRRGAPLSRSGSRTRG